MYLVGNFQCTLWPYQLLININSRNRKSRNVPYLGIKINFYYRFEYLERMKPFDSPPFSRLDDANARWAGTAYHKNKVRETVTSVVQWGGFLRPRKKNDVAPPEALHAAAQNDDVGVPMVARRQLFLAQAVSASTSETPLLAITSIPPPHCPSARR